MERMSGLDLQTEASEGGLRELVLRWFTETQASLILHNGNFPDWFQGFTARKDAEDLLRDKTLGCFLIRLSDKAIGYILSYKGQDRCRHFVVTQNQDGLFVISGDCQTHGSLTDLIEHYKVSPIQPFGEYLTSCCYEETTGELYDVVKYEAKQRSGVSVQALRSLWDQKSDRISDQRSDRGNHLRGQQQNDLPAVQPPALPPKSKNRKLTGTVSVGTMPLSQAVPPVPKRGMPLSHSLSGCLPDKTSHRDETHPDPSRAERQRGNETPEEMDGRVSPNRREDSMSFSPTDSWDPNPTAASGVTYSELTLMENRSKSLPRLDKNMEEACSSQHGGPSFTAPASPSPTPPKRVSCHTYSLHVPRDGVRPGARPEPHGDKLDLLKCNPLYQASDGPEESSPPQGDSAYAEVSQGPAPPSRRPPDDNTYELIPGVDAGVQGNTYETLEDVKTKKGQSTWGKNNIKWRKFLPEYKKK